jgi:hypothetical protein
MLAGLAACSQLTPASAPAAPAAPTATAAYTLEVIPASANWAEVVVRMATATGQATLAGGQNTTFIPVTEAAPPPSGVYKLYDYYYFDPGATTRSWEIYRLEAGSGRTWLLKFDGAKAASWVEIQ